MRASCTLLISPEFEGIKTYASDSAISTISLLISPEFEGIKTALAVFLVHLPRY